MASLEARMASLRQRNGMLDRAAEREKAAREKAEAEVGLCKAGGGGGMRECSRVEAARCAGRDLVHVGRGGRTVEVKRARHLQDALRCARRVCVWVAAGWVACYTAPYVSDAWHHECRCCAWQAQQVCSEMPLCPSVCVYFETLQAYACVCVGKPWKCGDQQPVDNVCVCAWSVPTRGSHQAHV